MQFPIPEGEVGLFVKQASLMESKYPEVGYVCHVGLSVVDREMYQSGDKAAMNFIFTGSGPTPDEAIKKMFDEALRSLKLPPLE